jgi:hypothetical protein
LLLVVVVVPPLLLQHQSSITLTLLSITVINSNRNNGSNSIGSKHYYNLTTPTTTTTTTANNNNNKGKKFWDDNDDDDVDNHDDDNDDSTSTITSKSIIFAVMGEAKQYSYWCTTIKKAAAAAATTSAASIDSRKKVTITKPVITFLYGSFDETVVATNNDDDVDDGFGFGVDGNGNGTASSRTPQQQTLNYFGGCHSVYLPNTTWTTGRNLLAEEIWWMEQQHQHRKQQQQQQSSSSSLSSSSSSSSSFVYDFWVFADDDIKVSSRIGHENSNGERNRRANTTATTTAVDDDGTWKSWRTFFDYLLLSHSSDDGGSGSGDNSINNGMPAHATQATIPAQAYISKLFPTAGHYSATTADAMLMAVRRQYVPYILPYVTLRNKESQWHSQACLFCIMKRCFQSSVAFHPTLIIRNSVHRGYARGINKTLILSTMQRNFENVVVVGNFTNSTMTTTNRTFDIESCQDMNFTQHQNLIGPYKTSNELNGKIPSHDYESCSPLLARFQQWEASILEKKKTTENKLMKQSKGKWSI